MRRRNAIPVPDIRPSEDDVITDDVEYDQPTVDIGDDWFTGKEPMIQPDQAPYAELVQTTMRMILEEIKAESMRLAQVDKQSMRVSTNLAGSVQFRRYALTSTMGMVQILWEKPYRGDTVITNLATLGSIWICDEPGLNANGSNTAEIPAGASRTIRTREELFAITDSATEVKFDVQEEFDS